MVVNTLKLGYNDENPFYEKIELNRHEATTLVHMVSRFTNLLLQYMNAIRAGQNAKTHTVDLRSKGPL